MQHGMPELKRLRLDLANDLKRELLGVCTRVFEESILHAGLG
jgi:hypothetical protein